MINKKLLAVSFSGGRTSAFMCQFLLNYPKYKDYDKVFVYANTGLEHPNTLKFIEQCDIAFGLNLVKLEAKVNFTDGVGVGYNILDYKDLSTDGKPFANVVKKYGLPTFIASMCTRSLKITPIDKYIKSLNYRYVFSAIGIRHDERHRLSKQAYDKGQIYPLIDDIQVDEHFIKSFWARQPFDLDIPDGFGNCDLCFKKSINNKMKVLQLAPDKAQFWLNLEQKFGTDKVPRFDLRQNLSIADLIELSKDYETKPTKPHKIKNWNRKTANLNLDLSFDCLCKSS